MDGIQNLEFKIMQPAQSEAVRNMVLKAVDTLEENGFTPQGRAAFERYVSPSALSLRGNIGYHHELAYMSGVLAGMIETRDAQITMLYVHPDYVHRGLGSRLVVRAVSRCAEAKSAKLAKHVTVHATDGSVDFYERLGFTRNGSRKESGGIFSTPLKLSLKAMDRSLSTKLHSKAVELFVFTGTGNSLLAAKTVAESLRQRGVSARLRSMDKPFPQNLDEDTAVGLALPVACFSTYPSVWRFIDSMPAGEGREVFMLGTCGGAAFGMQGPLRAILSKKGYKPIAAKVFTMPGNYNNKTMPAEKNAARVEKCAEDARSFAHDLLKGGMNWGGGVPLLSALMYRLGQTRWPWNTFYKVFPISADTEKCVRCKRCADECPVKAITMDKDNFPVVDGSICESCQRCVGFCPKGALGVPGKPAEPYRALTYEQFKDAFK